MLESRQPGVMAVVVAYGRGLDGVEAWPELRRQLLATGARAMGLAHVLIYDNSSQPLAKPLDRIDGCSYVHDATNGGTSAAYSCAIHLATQLEIDWLLLIDQDTCLPESFLEVAGAALKTSAAASPAALLPWVCHHSMIVSPARITRTGTIRPLRRGEPLRQGMRVTAIASGSILRVATMRTLLPIPNELWLDYVDHWIFAALHVRQAPVLIFDQVLKHDLSIATPTSLSLRRLTSILNGEGRFIDSLGLAARLVYPLRLTLRILRLGWISPRLASHMLGWAMRRLVLNRTPH